MPKAKREQPPAAALFPPVNGAPYLLPPPFEYTPFYPLLGVNGKNVASTFGKGDTQSWWARRADDELWEGQRGWKREVMMGGEREALLRRPPTDGVSAGSKGKSRAADVEDAMVVDGEEGVTEAETSVDPASRIIIIHPGARSTRLGRASDLAPVTIPTVIARRCGRSGSPGFHTDLEPPHDPESNESYESKISAIRADLRSRMRILKLRGTTNGQGLAAAYNAEVVPEVLRGFQDPFPPDMWTSVGPSSPDTFVGNDALFIPDPAASGYTVRWPLKGGTFNAFAASGYRSKSEILADIEAIWLHALKSSLGIEETDLKDFSAILIVPDLYDHVYLRDLLDLLFRSLGFKQVLLHQESLGACFGAGLGTACVVDVGASKASVCCVEEGWLLAESRMHLAFGGDDITVVLTEMLRRQQLPCKDVNLDRPWDWLMMDELKEQMIVLSEGDVALNIYPFYRRMPLQATRKYEVRVYDDVIVAPMVRPVKLLGDNYADVAPIKQQTLFAPRIIDFDAKLRRGPSLFSSAAELDDVLDLGGNAVTEAMRSCTAHLLPAPPVASGAAAEAGSQPAIHTNGIVPPEEAPRALSIVDGGQEEPPADSVPGTPAPSTHLAGQPSANPTRLPTPDPPAPAFDVSSEASKIPLHVAVAESIIACGSEERAKRMLGAIMIVGGGGLIHNIGYAVASRVQAIVAARWPNVGEGVVVPAPRDIDPRDLAWKGVSLMTRLDAVNDMWVRSSDWEALGAKAVKDRTLFI